MNLTQEQIELIKSLKYSRAFNEVYCELLKEKFAERYKKLRNSKRNDVSYGKVCGYLDGIEEALNMLETVLQEYQQ